MALALQITTLGGELLPLIPKAHWLVWDLKCAIERESGVPTNKQKLISVTGNELLDKLPLGDYTSPDGDATLLTLIHIPKTAEEIAWQERWAAEEIARQERWAQLTPAFWQRAAKVAIDGREFTEERERAFSAGDDCPFHGRATHWSVVRPRHCCCSNFVGRSKSVEDEGPSNMKTSMEVLRAVSRKNCIEIADHGDDIELSFKAGQLGIGVEKFKSCRDALFAAIEKDPALILPHVNFSIAAAAVQKFPGMYGRLPEHLRACTSIFYDALRCDPELRAEFLQTAGKSEVNAWRWHVNSSERRCRRKR